MIELFRTNDTRIHLSLDGYDEKSNRYRMLFNNRKMFPYAIRGYKKLKENDIKVAINSVITDNNVADMKENVKHFFEDFGCRNLGLTHPHFTESASASVDMDAYINNMIELFDYAKQNGIFIYQIARKIEPLLKGEYRFIGCKIAGEQRTFAPDGQQLLCTKLKAREATRNLSVTDLQGKLPLNLEYCHNKCLAEGVCGGGCYYDGRMFENEIPVDKRECMFGINLMRKFLSDMLEEHKEGGIEEIKDFKEIYRSMITQFK